ncbi:hypothetical protein D3C73_901760 [compost metagenome]
MHDIVTTGHKLEPASIIRGLLPRLASGGASRWAMQAITLARRYPLVSSSLSTLLMRGGKRSKLLKIAGGAFVGWQLFKMWRSSREDDR